MFDSFSVIGGDMRSLTLCEELRTSGYRVFLYGFENAPIADMRIRTEASLSFTLDSDIVILPVPVSLDT